MLIQVLTAHQSLLMVLINCFISYYFSLIKDCVLVSQVRGLSVWSLYVFSVSVKVLAGFSRFLTQSKNMRFGNLGILNWPV